jgi:hypothetical protein
MSLFADDLLVIHVGGYFTANLSHGARRDNSSTTVYISKVDGVGGQVKGGKKIGIRQNNVIRDVTD